MTTPSFETYLPDMWTFIHRLANAYTAGKLANQEQLAAEVRAFFTPHEMEFTDLLIPGWQRMASYAEGETLVHVMTVFMSLLLSDEYQALSPEQQNMAMWAVAFHDVAKEIHNGQRDTTHAFRSAAIVGKQLPKLGFPVVDLSTQEGWHSYTRDAIKRIPETGQWVQDNAKLLLIVNGIQRMFGENSPAALIAKTVLFHMSITVVEVWPQAAPLTDAEIVQYVDADLLPLLRTMMIVDGDAWSFFDQERRASEHEETQRVFQRISRMIEAT